MSKLRIIDHEKRINHVNDDGKLYSNCNSRNDLFIRPQTKTAYIIANDAILEGK